MIRFLIDKFTNATLTLKFLFLKNKTGFKLVKYYTDQALSLWFTDHTMRVG